MSHFANQIRPLGGTIGGSVPLASMLDRPQETFDPPLDPGIRSAVLALRDAGIDTFESCEGGPGHAYPVATVRFRGNAAEGWKALAAAKNCGLPVAELRRVWPLIDGEPTGPWWELTFVSDPAG